MDAASGSWTHLMSNKPLVAISVDVRLTVIVPASVLGAVGFLTERLKI